MIWRRVRRRLEKSETHYILNTIFLNDYCVWAQSPEEHWLVDESLKRLATWWGTSLKALSLDDVGLEIPRTG